MDTVQNSVTHKKFMQDDESFEFRAMYLLLSDFDGDELKEWEKFYREKDEKKFKRYKKWEKEWDEVSEIYS